jgi:quercetin dioxygenase-like cupin family protein
MIGTADISVRAVTLAARQPERRRTARLAKPVALMAAGLLASTGAVAVALLAGNGGTGGSDPASAPASALAPRTGTALQPSDFAMVAITYDPGQSSGWHVHPGIHAVHVLSGSLTVYDENCVGRTYGPDQSYVGGRDVHLARNETAEPLRMVVTYVEPGNPAPADLSFALPPPPNCPH